MHTAHKQYPFSLSLLAQGAQDPRETSLSEAPPAAGTYLGSTCRDFTTAGNRDESQVRRGAPGPGSHQPGERGNPGAASRRSAETRKPRAGGARRPGSGEPGDRRRVDPGAPGSSQHQQLREALGGCSLAPRPGTGTGREGTCGRARPPASPGRAEGRRRCRPDGAGSALGPLARGKSGDAAHRKVAAGSPKARSAPAESCQPRAGPWAGGRVGPGVTLLGELLAPRWPRVQTLPLIVSTQSLQPEANPGQDGETLVKMGHVRLDEN